MAILNPRSPNWALLLIYVGIGLFIAALAISAYLVPELRLLHALQSMIYVAVFILVRRNSPWGPGAGTVIALVWNSFNLFVTHLFQAGMGQWGILIRGGHLSRPDTLMVSVGGIGHFLLIAGCLAAFLSQPPTQRNWWKFVGGGLVSVAYFILIIIIAAPH